MNVTADITLTAFYTARLNDTVFILGLMAGKVAFESNREMGNTNLCGAMESSESTREAEAEALFML